MAPKLKFTRVAAVTHLNRALLLWERGPGGGEGALSLSSSLSSSFLPLLTCVALAGGCSPPGTTQVDCECFRRLGSATNFVTLLTLLLALRRTSMTGRLAP